MQTTEVEIPQEVLTLLKGSPLSDRPVADQVRVALATHLFQEGIISVGKAAAIAGEPRATFELLLGEMGIRPFATAATTSGKIAKRLSAPVKRGREDRHPAVARRPTPAALIPPCGVGSHPQYPRLNLVIHQSVRSPG